MAIDLGVGTFNEPEWETITSSQSAIGNSQESLTCNLFSQLGFVLAQVKTV